jgi:cytochrome c-type biogenesis protein
MSDIPVLIAFAGGMLSFLSPCVLPIVPAYLSMTTGLTASEVRSHTSGHTIEILRNASLFVLGFSVVFIVLGLTTTSLGQIFSRSRVLVTRISGVVLIAMSVFLLVSLVSKRQSLFREFRLDFNVSRLGPLASLVAGAVFGFAWTPCIGPVLTSVLAIAATQGQLRRGVVLMASYSAGLGVPFLITSLALERVGRTLGWFKRHARATTLASAAIFGLYGIVLLFNALPFVTSLLQRGFSAIGAGSLVGAG